MWKWLGKIAWWKPKSEDSGLVVHEYGRYLHKPVTCRAIAMVTRVPDIELELAIINEWYEVYLNGSRVLLGDLQTRLESGGYEIKIPSKNKAWTFFIG
tara:strand:+ start:2511 stop:2804 length:294 start_codon:yes stop_codon:yes gene_type:complete